MESRADALVGREIELQVLSTYLTSPDRRALILRGETGVGKSTLLDHASELATTTGHRVIRAVGAEAESKLPFAGLHQLLYPLLPDAEQLDGAHRAVLEAAFSGGDGTPPSTMTLGIAVLDLLSLATTSKPLLLVVDDGHWLDIASAEVCGFVGRRLAGSAVRLLLGMRSGVPSAFDAAALPEAPVPPLSRQAAEQVLDGRYPDLDPQLRERVLAEALGVPLALVELPPLLGSAYPGHGLDGGSRSGGGSFRHRFQHVYGTRIAALTPDVRAELLRGALDGVGAGAGSGPTRAVGYRMLDAEEAATCGLLDVDPVSGDFVFRHPLVRSTVVQLATPNERQAAHAVLAHVHRHDVERHATHLAAATVDPDEQVAATLEAASASARRRGGSAAAVAWLTRAAELSESREDRSRRLGDAAFVAGQAGLLDQAQHLVHVGISPGTDSPAAVLASAYVALYGDGEVRSTHRQLVGAVESLRDGTTGGPPETLARVVNTLLVISQYASNRDMWEETDRVLTSLGDLVPANSRLHHDAWSDVVRRGAGLAERVDRAFVDTPPFEPWDVALLCGAAHRVDTLGQYRSQLRRALDRERAGGTRASGIAMLHLNHLDQVASGDWAAAEESGERSLELATARGLTLFSYQSRAYLAVLAAMRGRLERARELQAQVDSWARPRGIGLLTQLADTAGTIAALSEGDYEAAYLHAIGITRPGSFEPYQHQASQTLLDLVEAALHTGRTQQARDHALAAQAAGLPYISPRLALLTYGVLSMTAEDEQEAAEMYARAEAHPTSATFPFELARIQLARGIRLRQLHGRRASRQLLSRAAASFELLGATAWTERALAELCAIDLPARASALPVTSLTWQERRIADLAASGLTNKEIGERTHLSPRTVSSHLYRVFPKLGVSSRAALRDALEKLPDRTSA
ncbi:helix-turn-helix transcriptional regulator [Streptacidiphilus jiangxiensis]|uniref:Regulatory protein, luxR family n=1 Tax=Streptacidiphilus jiangxiensis TaxID=235985 RepID=A0A1H7WFL3_STRJI|nr:LuxR family transcriptional regulator [Streptacidiphilus jiangxiensis]SEM20366.1 regulatory protein, luxR family [Streptacidiphilus jiangxiensis]